MKWAAIVCDVISEDTGCFTSAKLSENSDPTECSKQSELKVPVHRADCLVKPHCAFGPTVQTDPADMVAKKVFF